LSNKNIDIMETSSLIMGLVFLAIILVPIILLARAGKKKKDENQDN